MRLSILLLSVAFAASQTLQRTLLTDKEAQCSNGAQAGYYVAKTTNPSYADKWQVIMLNNQAGMIWCFPPGKVNESTTLGNCNMPGNTIGVTPPPIPATLNGSQFLGTTGMLSTNCTDNPDFCDFNKVLILSCDAANWLGNADRSTSNRTIKFRGQRVINSTITQLSTDLKFGPKTEIMMTGVVGGAHALYQYTDRFADYFFDVVGVLDYRAIFLDGFWPEWNGYWIGDVFAIWFGGNTTTAFPDVKDQLPQVGVWNYANLTGGVNPDCLKLYGETEQWKCAISSYGFPLIKRTKFYAMEQAWGTWGSFCLVNGKMAYDPNWDGWVMECDPRDGSLHICVEYGWECPPDYVTNYVNTYINNTNRTFTEPGILTKPTNGGFMHSCHLGPEDGLSYYWRSIEIDGVSLQESVHRWFTGEEKGVVRLPCLWGPNYTKPFKNCCNPTCPDIAYDDKIRNFRHPSLFP
eukprot:TRINITY_DN1845_c1_g1_i1.p1 TRINITY_DN1845_c1_g1~~TRINITY_DN1845_c1_g1_i1.p1  ORF type:complete len:463 (+),score=84.81 TRINITY_DN1845_c1_g1_i1:80-1468(+)